MPRKGRETSSTGIYHVMLRGINRQDIFEELEDYWTFIRILSAVHECPTTSFSICGKTMKNNDSKFNQKPVPLIAKTWDVNGWNVSFTCDFIGLDSDEAVNKALETNPAANALCYDANLPSNGEWDPSSRTLTLGSHRGGMGLERGSTINHEIGHSWGLPHENLMPNSPIYGKDNKEGTGIMSYGSYRTIQNYEVEYGVEKILKNVPEDHPSSMNLHIK